MGSRLATSPAGTRRSTTEGINASAASACQSAAHWIEVRGSADRLAFDSVFAARSGASFCAHRESAERQLGRGQTAFERVRCLRELLHPARHFRDTLQTTGMEQLW